MKRHLSTIVLVLAFVTGVGLLLYPSVSDYYNSFHQTRAIATYTEQIAAVNEEQYAALWNAAVQYNQELAASGNQWVLSPEQAARYEAQLNVSGTGAMGYIDIPSIDCYLPVYHGTSTSVLQRAVGHIEGSSLPVGGAGSHTVLSAHRGLPSARLFTDLDRLQIGDVFVLHTLNEALWYEVDQILIVEPNEVDALKIAAGQDYCTLVTCTPYGINTHRLLVRGHRVEAAAAAEVPVTADAVQIDPLVVAPVVATPVLLGLFGALLVRAGRRSR